MNLLWVPHYHCSNINTTYIRQLLTLVHDGCLCLGAPIPITNILSHRIMLLPHEGLNSAKEFGGKASEHDLAENMKKKFELLKKLHGYSITSINDLVVKISTKIIVGKVMRKCRMDEVSVPVISLGAQCMEGMQFNWSR